MHTIISQFMKQGIEPPVGDVALIGTPTTFVYSGSDTTSNSFSHTRLAAAQKGGLVALVMTEFPPNSVTYNGVNLTLGRSDGFDEAGTTIWVGPDTLSTGSNTVVVNHSASQNGCVVQCENLENFEQTTMVGNTNGESGASLGSSSLAVTISVGSLMVSCLSKKGTTPSLNGDGNQASLMTVQGSSSTDAIASYNTSQTAGSKTLAYTWGSTSNTSHTTIELLNG